MKYLLWLLKAAIFFTLFAFALNNQQAVNVNFFFGTYWRAPMVLVVLVAVAVGLVIGALGMLPGFWKQRANTAVAPASPATADASTAATPSISTAASPDAAAARSDGL
ncbi:MAG: lipopolysaccharide assembly protein LapA domain-containing protein [Variovorax sp.]